MVSSKRINRVVLLVLCVAAVVMGVVFSKSVAQQPAPPPAPATTQAATQPFVQAGNPIEAGKYLIDIGGCHDCHTPGWMQTGGVGVADEVLLTGVSIGFRGPWGTTYGSNLRIFASQLSEEEFVKVLKARNTRPPMPWSVIHAMSNQDLRAIYKYITSLKPLGKAGPAFVPPGVEPKTPYFVLDPSVTPKAYGATQPATAPTTAPATAPTTMKR